MATPSRILASQRFTAEHGWLKSHHLFSFDQYYDPDNVKFGALRVFNHDFIAGHTGFDPHPHREMEIVTIVLRGSVSHTDSTGSKGATGHNEVQVMHAGTGIVHSEHNLADDPLELFQLWFLPARTGVTPGYAQHSFVSADWRDKVSLLVGPPDAEAPLHIESNAWVYRTALSPSQSLPLPWHIGCRLFVYVFAGMVTVNGPLACAGDGAGRDWELAIGDQLRWAEAPNGIRLEAGSSGAEAMVILA